MGEEAVQRLAVDLRRFTLEAADERRRAGELEFHDLLVLARDTLRDPEHGPTVRAALRQRYRHLLIDEFQDTDPIQIDLAVLIAGDDDVAPGTPWPEVATHEGQLFFVGDPKQSIYRFRRADISVFLQAADRFGPGGRRLALTTNFRTGRAIVERVNLVFGDLMRATDVAGSPSQPAYAPLVAVRPDAPVGPPVAVLGAAAHEDAPSAAVLRQRESADVAAAIRRVLAEGWLVEDAHSGPPTWRPARLGDITILLPTRTSLPALEDALGAAGVSYRTESASLVYASRLVRDVLLTLRAVDDPSDELAVVAALRSPLFACGDDDLYRYRRTHGGSFDHGVPPPESVPTGDPVGAGLAYLHDLHEARLWATPSELADRVVRDRRVLELGEADGRPRDLWRRMRFVVDQARAWTDATNGTLRQYLAWIRQQTAEGSRVAEAVLPETDDDAVRIMTVHAAKGLEFPVTILAGLSTQPQRRRAGAEVIWPPGERCLIRVGNAVVSDAYEARVPLDEQMSHDERIRLLYVACTRAQDHLIVSLHRKSRVEAASSSMTLTSAELLASALDDRLADLPVLGVDPDEAPTPPTAGGGDPVPEPATEIAAALPDLDDWRRAGRGGSGQRDPHDGRRHGPDRRRPPRRGGRPGPAQATPRPRPPPVAEGPLRHGDRPGGPCGDADDRPGDGRRQAGGGSSPGRRRGRDRTRAASGRPGRRRVGGPGRGRGGGRPPLARAVCGRAAGGRKNAGRLRRPPVPPGGGPGGGRLQDGPGGPGRRPRRPGRPLPHAGSGIRPGGRRRHRRTGGRGHVRVPHAGGPG